MRRAMMLCVAACLAGAASVASQTGDVDRVLGEARQALGGGEKLAAVKTLAATGHRVRIEDDKPTSATDTEIVFELPDRFMRRDVVLRMESGVVTHRLGFYGGAPINVFEQPAEITGSFQFRASTDAPADQTPEQQTQALVRAARQDFSRFALGMLLPPLPAYPLEFSYGGPAEPAEGKADIIDVRGEGGFAVRLFIDTRTHLPLMLSWMAKEPPQRTGSAQRFNGEPTPRQREQMQKESAQRRKEAMANLRVVEYRQIYGDYRNVDAVMVPFGLQRTIDGKRTEQVTFDDVKINGKINPKKFDTKQSMRP